MPYSFDKRIINKVFIDPETLELLTNIANQHGEDLASFAGQVLDKFAETYSPVNKESLGQAERFYWNKVEILRRKKRVDAVFHAAAVYQENPSEDIADMLESMCEGAGLDVKEVIKQVSDDPFSSIVANTRNGTKFGACLRWLPSELRKRGGTVSVSILCDAGDREGYSYSMLERAKRAINNDVDTPSIMSVKTGKSWIWRIEMNTDEEVIQLCSTRIVD